MAFVFSVPGTEEALKGKPVAGDTGENLDLALVRLHAAHPSLFGSMHRYDYRITNAFSEPIAVALGHTASEAKNTEIRNPQNVERVCQELQGCSHVVLCGGKAKLLLEPLIKSGKVVVAVSHVGNKGLNKTFKLKVSDTVASSSFRRKMRVGLWADDVLCRLGSEEAA